MGASAFKRRVLGGNQRWSGMPGRASAEGDWGMAKAILKGSWIRTLWQQLGDDLVL